MTTKEKYQLGQILLAILEEMSVYGHFMSREREQDLVKQIQQFIGGDSHE